MEKHKSVEVLLNGKASRTHKAYKDEDFKGKLWNEEWCDNNTFYFKRSPASRAQHTQKVVSWSVIMVVSDGDLDAY